MVTVSEDVLIGFVESCVLKANLVAAEAASVFTVAVLKSVVRAVILAAAVPSPAATKAETDFMSASRLVCPVAAMLKCAPALIASLLNPCRAFVTAVTDVELAAMTSLKLATSTVELTDVIELSRMAVNFV